MRTLLRAGLVLGFLASSTVGLAENEPPPPHSVEEAGRQRVERQRSVAELSPGPTATGLPLSGKKGRGADGYPTQHVDRPAVRALLRARRFTELTRHLEALQAAFEADPRNEEWPTHFVLALEAPEAELAPLFDAWVQATPKSFAPYLARGAYHESLGFARRGGRFVADTHVSDFAAMEHAHRQAIVDLERALEMRPRLLAARILLISIARAGADRATVDRVAKLAIEACPTCLLPRIDYMYSLEPRWGGSYEAMAAFAKSAPAAKNPRLRALAGFVDLDKANELRREHRAEDALAAVERACATGENWHFLVARAELLDDNDRIRARRDLARALELNPFEPTVLFEAARMASVDKEYERAALALMAGLRIDPTDDRGKSYFAAIVNGLIFEGGQLRQKNRYTDALRLFELATDLDPRNHEAQGGHAWLLTHGPKGEPLTDIDGLRAQLRSTPDDLRAHQRVDYLLAQKGRYAEVVEVWNGYIGRHPDDGRALLERGGAYHHLGQREAALADASRACELGVSEGCARAKGTR